MATFKIRDGQLALEFSPLEKLGSLRSGATVGLTDIHMVEKVDAWAILDGLRFGIRHPVGHCTRDDALAGRQPCGWLCGCVLLETGGCRYFAAWCPLSAPHCHWLETYS